MSSIREMNPYEIIRGLMNGDTATFKAGYTAENAVKVALEVHEMSEPEEASLRTYAKGYGEGLAIGKHLAERQNGS